MKSVIMDLILTTVDSKIGKNKRVCKRPIKTTKITVKTKVLIMYDGTMPKIATPKIVEKAA